MLAGTVYYTLDRKGRLVIPDHFRRQLGESFMLTQAPGGALLAMSFYAWDCFLARQAGQPERLEFFLSGAHEVSVQTRCANRILIPPALRQHADLRPHAAVALAGVGAAVAIADEELWTSRLRRIETALLAELDRPAPPLWADRLVDLPAIAREINGRTCLAAR